MKKVILSVATVLVTGLSMAQWTKKYVNNGFDDPYKICFTETDNRGFLKLENTGEGVAFYLQGGYHCEDYPIVDLSFLVNNKWEKHIVFATKSDNSSTIFLTDSIESEPYFKSFLNATSVKIRVNEVYCERDIYQFNMSGSTSAFNFIKK